MVQKLSQECNTVFSPNANLADHFHRDHMITGHKGWLVWCKYWHLNTHSRVAYPSYKQGPWEKTENGTFRMCNYHKSYNTPTIVMYAWYMWYDAVYKITVRYLIVLVQYKGDTEVKYEGTILLGFCFVFLYRTACSVLYLIFWYFHYYYYY